MFVNVEHISNVAKIYQDLKEVQAPEKLLNAIKGTLQEMQSYFLGDVEDHAMKVVRKTYVESGLIPAIKEYRIFYPNVNLGEARRAVGDLCYGLTRKEKCEPPFEECSEICVELFENDERKNRLIRLADTLKKTIPINYEIGEYRFHFYYKHGICDANMIHRLEKIIKGYLEFFQ